MKTSIIFHDDFEKCSELWPAPLTETLHCKHASFKTQGYYVPDNGHKKRKTQSTLGLVSRIFLQVGTSCSIERSIHRF